MYLKLNDFKPLYKKQGFERKRYYIISQKGHKIEVPNTLPYDFVETSVETKQTKKLELTQYQQLKNRVEVNLDNILDCSLISIGNLSLNSLKEKREYHKCFYGINNIEYMMFNKHIETLCLQRRKYCQYLLRLGIDLNEQTKEKLKSIIGYK